MRYDHILHRIRALIDIQDENGEVKIHAGDLGGWIENEENLSQEGGCWVGDEAKVYGNAKVYDNAQVYGNADVYGGAQVYGEARVCGDAQVFDNARVFGKARVCGDAQVFDNAWICDDAQVSGEARIWGNAQVCSNAQVCGNARVCGNAWVCGDAWVSQNDHYMTIGSIGSRNGTTTFFRDTAWTIWVVCGCFFGTLAEFRKKVKETHGDNKHAKVYLMAADMAELQIDTTPIREE